MALLASLDERKGERVTMNEIWRSDLDLALQALGSVQRMMEHSGTAETGPLTSTLRALDASRTAGKQVNQLISALIGQARDHGADWQLLGYSFDAYEE